EQRARSMGAPHLPPLAAAAAIAAIGRGKAFADGIALAAVFAVLARAAARARAATVPGTVEVSSTGTEAAPRRHAHLTQGRDDQPAPHRPGRTSRGCAWVERLHLGFHMVGVGRPASVDGTG